MQTDETCCQERSQDGGTTCADGHNRYFTFIHLPLVLERLKQSSVLYIPWFEIRELALLDRSKLYMVLNNGNIFSRQYSSCRLPGRSRIAKFCFTKLGYLSNCIQLSNSVVMLSCGDLELNPGPRESNESRKTEGKSSRITAFRSIQNNLKIAHLNTRSIKCRDHFILVKGHSPE